MNKNIIYMHVYILSMCLNNLKAVSVQWQLRQEINICIKSQIIRPKEAIIFKKGC